MLVTFGVLSGFDFPTGLLVIFQNEKVPLMLLGYV